MSMWDFLDKNGDVIVFLVLPVAGIIALWGYQIINECGGL